jgi:hypothetical protein
LRLTPVHHKFHVNHYVCTRTETQNIVASFFLWTQAANAIQFGFKKEKVRTEMLNKIINCFVVMLACSDNCLLGALLRTYHIDGSVVALSYVEPAFCYRFLALLIFVVRSGANNSFCTHVTIRLLYKEIC